MQSDGEFLTGLWFANSKSANMHNGTFVEQDLEIFEQTSRWLSLYFRGEVPAFVPKYKLEKISNFQDDVLSIVKKIPYGTTLTYGEIARQIAEEKHINKMSAQAVGGAVGKNPICLIIPCHRVVGANGKLVGYGGGIENKIALLKLEKNSMGNFNQ